LCLFHANCLFSCTSCSQFLICIFFQKVNPCLLLILGLGALLLADALPAMQDEHNLDAYFRMILAQQLWQDGDWFNYTFARTNPPFGMETLWTRPPERLASP